MASKRISAGVIGDITLYLTDDMRDVRVDTPGVWTVYRLPRSRLPSHLFLGQRVDVLDGPEGISLREVEQLPADSPMRFAFGEPGATGMRLTAPDWLAQEPWPDLSARYRSAPSVDVTEHYTDAGPLYRYRSGMRARVLAACSSPPGVTFPSIIGKMYRDELAAKAQRTATAKLTHIAERSRDTMKREAARVELLARMAPAPLPVMRDEWDNLPDAEPDGIVRRP